MSLWRTFSIRWITWYTPCRDRRYIHASFEDTNYQTLRPDGLAQSGCQDLCRSMSIEEVGCDTIACSYIRGIAQASFGLILGISQVSGYCQRGRRFAGFGDTFRQQGTNSGSGRNHSVVRLPPAWAPSLERCMTKSINQSIGVETRRRRRPLSLRARWRIETILYSRR